jgi:hypothetical protein
MQGGKTEPPTQWSIVKARIRRLTDDSNVEEKRIFSSSAFNLKAEYKHNSK